MLTDFFGINMPYGMKRNSKGEWMFFNREYVPLGWNTTGNHQSIYGNFYSELPIYTKYKVVTEGKLEELAWGKEGVQRENGEIVRVFFYNDRTNPMNDSDYWNSYFEKIKLLSGLKIVEAIK